MYDPWVGRWWGVDPLADMYSEWTPYCYGLNSPISTIDPDGMSSEKVNDEECETCPIVKGDYIPGTTTQASTDEVVITAKKKEDEPTTMAASTDEFLIFREFEQIEADYMAQARLDYQMTHMATGGLTHVDPVFDFLSGGGKAVGMTLGALITRKYAAGLLGSAAKGGGLSNPFKNATLSRVDEAFQVHVQSGKLKLKYVNPKTGAKAYQNTKSGYSYNLDPGGMYGKKLELPHIDVNYPNPKPLNVAPKKKLPVSGGF